MQEIHIDDNLLDRYAMGTLPAAAIPNVEEHLLGCSFCQGRLVEIDEFLPLFRAAASLVVVRPEPFWKRFQRGQRLIWGGSAVVTAAVMLLLISGAPQVVRPQPAILMMQSLRGPEAKAQMARGTPGLLVFDVPLLPGRPDYEIEVVDTAGNPILKGAATVKEEQLTFRIEKLAPAAYWVRVYQKQPTRVLVAEYGLQAK
jgi:hypothetical protein